MYVFFCMYVDTMRKDFYANMINDHTETFICKHILYNHACIVDLNVYNENVYVSCM